MLLKKKDKILKSYDVIVIGSGLAGLTAANKLAKDGRSVLLLEAHNKLGGFATWFRRNANEASGCSPSENESAQPPKRHGKTAYEKD